MHVPKGEGWHNPSFFKCGLCIETFSPKAEHGKGGGENSVTLQ